VSVDQLRPLIRELAKTCEEHAFSWMLNQEPSVADLKVDIPEIVNVYVQSAALLAADWYNDQESESSYFATPVDGIADERLDNLASWVHDGPQKPENKMRVAANTLVFEAARNTVYQNAQVEGVAVVRYEYADSCDGCVARATTSARARNSRSADVATDFHPSCEGMLVPVRNRLWEPPEYARKWRQRIDDARRAGNTTPDDIERWLRTARASN
jgi:hypothetical protein